MKILCLYNNDCALELFAWLQEGGNETVLRSEGITAEWCKDQKFDLAVSYTYRYILTEDILTALNYNAVNLHNSYLPWNRGADPNIWSIVEGTPRGVTLHYMDSGLDKGYIIAQEFVGLDAGETLKSSYYALDRAAKDLFRRAFAHYSYWPEMKKAPMGRGTYHSLRDGEALKNSIESYDVSVRTFLAKCPRGEKQSTR